MDGTGARCVLAVKETLAWSGTGDRWSEAENWSLIEVTSIAGLLKDAIFAFSQCFLILTAVMSGAAALLLFVAMHFMMVALIRRVLA